MKKRIITVLFAVFICMTAVMPVYAAGDLPRLVDDADLLTNSEESTLLSLLDDISERQQVDIVVVTVDSLDGKSAQDYADDFYDYNGYGFGSENDGILLLISMEDRDWYISTTGYGITVVTDAGLEYMYGTFSDDLSDGNYAEAFTTFAEQCDDFITQANTGKPYDSGNLPKAPFGVVKHIIIAVAIGFIVALIVTGIMKSKLKSVHSQPSATDYVKKDSMHITENREMFLYRHIDRKEKPKNNGSGSSTHTSSSGTTHGGGGGKF